MYCHSIRQKIIIGHKRENVSSATHCHFQPMFKMVIISNNRYARQGTYNEREDDVKGEIDFTAVNLAKLDSTRKALSRSGPFPERDKFIFTGKVSRAL
jgi:hypothetical protein